MARGRIEELPIPEVPRAVECREEWCKYHTDGTGRSYGYYNDHRHFAYEDYTFSVLSNEQIEQYDGKLYKWLGRDMRSTAGGQAIEWELGRWNEPDSKYLSTCAHGLHCLKPGQRGFNGNRLFLAEADGPIMITSGKCVAMRLRVVKEIDLTVNEEDIETIADLAWKKRWQQARPYRVPAKVAARYVTANRRASLKHIQRDAKPLIKRFMEIEMLFARTKANWANIEGPRVDDWQSYHAVLPERARLQRQLRHLERIAYELRRKPSLHELPVSSFVDPEYHAYLTQEV